MDKEYIDLRSDTVTKPTPEMRDAIFEAELGDDVLAEDPTVNLLEKIAASRLGKDSAILVPSGTFANQLALFTHCERGDEVILSENSHIVQHEAAASSILASVQLRTISPEKHFITREEIEQRIRKEEDIHFPHTGLITLENALSSGVVRSLESMKNIYNSSHKKYDIPIHLDGARIFNAAAHLGISAAAIAKYADSVMFCLSKGLSAPVGSLLVGSSDFIKKARKLRKIMGGGMRQAGIIAAAGIVALEKMTTRLKADHEKAQILAEAFNRTEIFYVDMDNVMINMFFVKLQNQYKAGNIEKFVELLRGERILTYPPEHNSLRFVTHQGIRDADVDYIIKKLPKLVAEFKRI